MGIAEILSNAPRTNEMLEAVRDNISKNAFFWLLQCGRIKPKYINVVRKWLNECRSILIRFLLLKEDDWAKMMEIMAESKRADYKGEPSLKQVKASQLSVLIMTILYRHENPFEYDLVVANHQQFAHMIESHKKAGTDGWSVFCKYIYAFHHEVFHSYEDYILRKYETKLDFILPSLLSKPGNIQKRFNDCVLRGLTNDFPKKMYFNYWLQDFENCSLEP
jgi:hypothetical protein